MIKENITIINELGLHARAASKFVNTATRFKSEVWLEKDGNKINAKSIMGVMMLAAGKGTELELEINGADEKTCFEALRTLINNRFDEGQ